MYLHVYNCLVIIFEYRSAVHGIILMGGAGASETLIEGYICTKGGIYHFWVHVMIVVPVQDGAWRQEV